MKKLNEFREQLISGEASKDDWLNFKKVASQNFDSLPSYLKLYLADLKHIEATGISKSEIVILDHGCGSGVTVLFLLANGYTKVFGVDPKTHKYKNLNKNLSELTGEVTRPFLTYLPDNKIELATGTVNYIFSNQVMEHLSDEDLVSFLTEEQRLKSEISIIRHSFPTRNTFFETHTKTIILHWLLNRSLFNRMFSEKKKEWLEQNLFLRWDNLYEKAFTQIVGSLYQENTARIDYSLENFAEGKAKSMIRALFHAFMEVPIFQPFLKLIYRNFATKEFVQRNL